MRKIAIVPVLNDRSGNQGVSLLEPNLKAMCCIYAGIPFHPHGFIHCFNYYFASFVLMGTEAIPLPQFQQFSCKTKMPGASPDRLI